MNAHVEAFYEYMDAMDWFDTCNGLKRAVGLGALFGESDAVD